MRSNEALTHSFSLLASCSCGSRPGLCHLLQPSREKSGRDRQAGHVGGSLRQYGNHSLQNIPGGRPPPDGLPSPGLLRQVLRSCWPNQHGGDPAPSVDGGKRRERRDAEPISPVWYLAYLRHSALYGGGEDGSSHLRGGGGGGAKKEASSRYRRRGIGSGAF